MSLRPFNNYDLEGFPPVLAWNPIAMRCSRVDEGCRNCWHMRAADRLMMNPVLPMRTREAYNGCEAPLAPVYGMNTDFIFPKKPSIIAVQFMGDVWYERIPDDDRYQVIRACRNAPQHIFLLLTKRPERVTEELPENCWLGTSVHDQDSANIRVKRLLEAKCKHRWLSFEPMLGPVDYDMILKCTQCVPYNCEFHGSSELLKNAPCNQKIEWVACGPETGAGARPCKSEWIADVAQHCKYKGIPFYDKRDPSAPGFTVQQWPQEWKLKIGIST